MKDKARELIEKAKAATPGPWTPRVVDKEIWSTNLSGSSERISTFFYPSGPFQKVDDRFLVRSHPQSNIDSEYIAAANPQAITEICETLLRYRGVLEFYAELDSGYSVVAKEALSEKEK